jgi:hypothetical protein
MTADRDDGATTPRFRLADRVERGGFLLFAFGLVGLAAGWISRWSAGLTEAEQTTSSLGFFLVSLFSGALLTGLLIVLSFASLLRRRAIRLASPDAVETIPAGLAWSLCVIVFVAALYLIYMLVRYGILMHFAH